MSVRRVGQMSLADRPSFRRFVGLSLTKATPDHSTISRFRTALGAAGLGARLFEAVTRQIDAQGLLLRQGTLIDASLVEAPVRRPRKPEVPAADAEADPAAKPEAGSVAAPAALAAPAAVPRPPSLLVANPLDPEASWAKKGGRRYFGYKAHVGVDLGSNIIRVAQLTTAAVADTTVTDALIPGDEAVVYGDKAYDTQARRAALRARGAWTGSRTGRTSVIR